MQLKFQLVLWWCHGLLVNEVHPMGGYPIWQFLKLEIVKSSTLSSRWRWMSFIQKSKMFYQLKWSVVFNKNLVTSMLVEKLTRVSRLQLCCGFDSTLSTILVGSWKHYFELKKNNLQLEGTFSTSKCSWNIVEIIVENLGFLIVDKHFGVGEPQSPNKLVIHSRLSYGDKCHILWCIGWGTMLYPMGFVLDFWEETAFYGLGWQLKNGCQI